MRRHAAGAGRLVPAKRRWPDWTGMPRRPWPPPGIRFQRRGPALGKPPEGLVQMTGLLAAKPAWELALEALKGLGAQAPAGTLGEANGKDRRMAWLLGLHGELATLSPRTEARQTWRLDQGRPVALQRLAESPDGFPYLTPQDREICACILREQETTWYNGQERTIYRMDTDRPCWPPLVIRWSSAPRPARPRSSCSAPARPWRWCGGARTFWSASSPSRPRAARCCRWRRRPSACAWCSSTPDIGRLAASSVRKG